MNNMFIFFFCITCASISNALRLNSKLFKSNDFGNLGSLGGISSLTTLSGLTNLNGFSKNKGRWFQRGYRNNKMNLIKKNNAFESELSQFNFDPDRLLTATLGDSMRQQVLMPQMYPTIYPNDMNGVQRTYFLQPNQIFKGNWMKDEQVAELPYSFGFNFHAWKPSYSKVNSMACAGYNCYSNNNSNSYIINENDSDNDNDIDIDVDNGNDNDNDNNNNKNDFRFF